MLNNLKQKLMAFMQGRYGPDAMYKGLFGLSLTMLVLNIILRSALFYYLALALIIYSMYRFFSKDRSRRAAENQRYLALVDKIKKKLLLTKNRIRDIGTHRYRSCPSCKTPLRLKKQIGPRQVKCPVCGNEFEVQIKF